MLKISPIRLLAVGSVADNWQWIIQTRLFSFMVKKPERVLLCICSCAGLQTVSRRLQILFYPTV